MKGFVLGVVFTASLAATAAYAGFWDSIADSRWDSVETKQYLVEVKGFNVHAYDFVNTYGATCTATFSNRGPVGVSCTK